MPVIIYLMKLTDQARYREIMASFPDPDGNYMHSSGDSIGAITTKAAMIMLLFLSFFIYLNIVNIIRVKTSITRSLGILGLTLIILGVLYDFLILASPRHISFDEGGLVYFIGAVLMCVFSIVFLIQSYKSNQNKQKTDSEILDDNFEVT